MPPFGVVLDKVDADDGAGVEWVFSLILPLCVVLDTVDSDDEAGVDISTELPCGVVVVILTEVLSEGILVLEVENGFVVEEGGGLVVDVLSHPKS